MHESTQQEIGKYYCKRCNKLFGRSSPELHRFGLNLKCDQGHYAMRVSSGWLEGGIGLLFPLSLLHAASLIETIYPLAWKLLFGCISLLAAVCLLKGLQSRNQHAAG